MKRRNRWKFLCLLLLTISFSACTAAAHPESVFIQVSDSPFTITNAQGHTLTFEKDFEGTIECIETSHLDAEDDPFGSYALEVPYSNRFVYQSLDGDKQKFSIAFSPNSKRMEYGITGTGISNIELDLSGKVECTGTDFQCVAFFSMPCDGLGEHGVLRFTCNGKESAAFSVKGNTLSFSGISPEFASISYAGLVSNPYLNLDLQVGSGKLDFSQISEDILLLIEDGQPERSISIDS